MILTGGAVATAAGEALDLARAVWGLLRSAQSEHPSASAARPRRHRGLPQRSPRRLALEAEPQLALREGTLLAPRLARVAR